jgi:hypothetical protein
VLSGPDTRSRDVRARERSSKRPLIGMSGRDLDSNRSQSQAGASEWSPRGCIRATNSQRRAHIGLRSFVRTDLARH